MILDDHGPVWETRVSSNSEVPFHSIYNYAQATTFRVTMEKWLTLETWALRYVKLSTPMMIQISFARF